MEDDTLLPFSLPALQRKKVTAAFDGGRLTSDGGVLLLSGADRQLGRNRCGHSTLATRPARDEITRAWQARSGV
jgi:hypothetical protein